MSDITYCSGKCPAHVEIPDVIDRWGCCGFAFTHAGPCGAWRREGCDDMDEAAPEQTIARPDEVNNHE